VDALHGGHPLPGATAWDGFAATVVAACAVEAYRTGGWVDVVLPPRPELYPGPAVGALS
jgi:myo-inositol 2-dehydrogenase / D-chiro-inositol 1-dehydrogenase